MWLDSLIRGTRVYQDLLVLAQDSSTARTFAEDRARLLEDEVGYLRSSLDQAHAETLNAHKKLENILWEQKYGAKLYPDAGPDLPTDSTEPQPLQARGVQARLLVRRAQRSLFENLHSTLGDNPLNPVNPFKPAS